MEVYHYVYRITNVKVNKHYYGARTCRGILPIEDLGIKYFSSSHDKEFIKDQLDNPINYKYKIVKIFNNREKAIEFEILLHNKFNVSNHKSFYNKYNQSSTKWDSCGTTHNRNKGVDNPMYGKTRPEHSLRMRGQNNPFYNKKHSDEVKIKCGQNNKGMVVCRDKETNEIVRLSKSEFENNQQYVGLTVGNHMSDETKHKISIASKGKKKARQKKLTCPHCGKTCAQAPSTRFHFDKCKFKK